MYQMSDRNFLILVVAIGLITLLLMFLSGCAPKQYELNVYFPPAGIADNEPTMTAEDANPDKQQVIKLTEKYSDLMKSESKEILIEGENNQYIIIINLEGITASREYSSDAQLKPSAASLF